MHFTRLGDFTRTGILRDLKQSAFWCAVRTAKLSLQLLYFAVASNTTRNEYCTGVNQIFCSCRPDGVKFT